MKISIVTLFPEMFNGPFDHSIVKRAQENGKVVIEYINLREFGIGKHQLVDDTPYGGGIGMILRVDVVHKAITHTKAKFSNQFPDAHNQFTVLLSANGKQFKQDQAKQFSALDHLILICGHYEGVDDRINHFIDAEISVGDFIVTGGELPAMLITDAVTRLLPGVITEGATEHESFSYTVDGEHVLEYPHYTKPPTYEGHDVPEILLSGHHAKIETWRKTQAKQKTLLQRPDLLKK